jgi:Papain family cysteine protease
MKKIILSFLLVILMGVIYSQESNFKTGLIFSTPEQLEGIPLAHSPYSGKELSKLVDLSDKLPTPGNQGRQQSCVGWATGYALKAYQEKLETNTLLNFSPSFIYNQINNGRDGGSSMIDALNILSQQGICTNDEMPYNDKDYLTKPTEAQKSKAKKYKIDFWRRVNIKEVKAQINAGYPVVIAAAIDEGFGKINLFDSKSIWKQQLGNKLGGHAMVVIGYNDDNKAFKIINSWGTSWGANGYGWIDYTYFPKVVKEGYVAKDAINTYDKNETIPNKPNVVNVLPVAPAAPNNNIITSWKVPDSIKKLAAIEIAELMKTDPDTKLDLTNKDDLKEFIKRSEQNPNYLQEFNAKILEMAKKMPITFYTAAVTQNEYDSVNKSKAIRITGHLAVAPGRGNNFSIVTHYYDASTNLPVLSAIQPTYADVNGFAASGTDEHKIETITVQDKAHPLEVSFTWTIAIPYNALNIKTATNTKKNIPYVNKMYAVPTIYIDGFGVKSGEKIYFTVTK